MNMPRNTPKVKIDVKEIRKITDQRFVNLYELRYLDKNGQEKKWDFASRQDPPRVGENRFDIPDAVVIVPFHTEKQKLVIIREFRIPLADFEYGFPAGLVDPGETVETCARRELAEETGLQVTRVHRTSPPVYSSSGLTDESVAMIYLDCNGEHSDKQTGSTEDIQTLYLSPEEAARLCADSGIKMDVKTWLVMSVFAETGRI